MSKKNKQQYNISGAAAWQTMSAGVRKSKEYYKKDKAGWGKIFGEVDIVSSDIEESQVESEGVKKNYFARFQVSLYTPSASACIKVSPSI